MRCPGCNKFPAFEIVEPEMDFNEVEHGVVTGTVRLVLNSECCGEECKEFNFDLELDLSDAITDVLKEAGVENPNLEADGVEFEITHESSSGDDRYESTNAKGKPISPRYQKHFYVATVEVTVQCVYPVKDAAPITVSVDGQWTDECQAGSMDELV